MRRWLDMSWTISSKHCINRKRQVCMMYTCAIANCSPLWSSHAVSRLDSDKSRGGRYFYAFNSPFTLYLRRMDNILLETVHFCLASGQKLLWPDTICGRTIRSTCTSHFGLDSGAPNSLGQDYLQVLKPGLTVQDRRWISGTILWRGWQSSLSYVQNVSMSYIVPGYFFLIGL